LLRILDLKVYPQQTTDTGHVLDSVLYNRFDYTSSISSLNFRQLLGKVCTKISLV